MSDVEELIKEIAVKHGISVGRDDPILILQTINKRLLEDSAKAQQEILDHYKEEMETLAKRWGDDARAKAERVLNAALTASRDMMVRTVQETAAIVKQTIRQQIESSFIKIRNQVRDTRHVVIISLIASGIALTAAFIALWTVR